MSGIFLVAAKRTPFGAFGGSLKGLTCTDMGVVATKAALDSCQLDPEAVDSIFFGNVIQASPDAAYLARHVGLKSGMKIAAPSLTVNRLCGSGFETVIQGANSIKLGESQIAICGGAENMSDAPLNVRGNDARWGVKLGTGLKMGDSLWDGLTDLHAGTPMGVTAENLAKQYGITREECDAFAVRSQQTWGKAKEAGLFDYEIAPVEVKTRKGMKVIDTDEHPRPETTVEQLSKLPTRTPFGTFGGSLKGLTCTDMGVVATKAALDSCQLDPEAVDSIFFGNVIQASPDAAYLARHVGLKSGMKIAAPSLTVNRLCGSGFETVIQGANSIKLGESQIAICGGAENMSDAPLNVRGNDARWGVKLGTGLKMSDALWDGLTDLHAGTPMGVTAENLAKQYGITREECDAFAVRSQQTWGKAKEAGLFDYEIAPVEVKTRKGMKVIDTDEHPRPETTVEQLSKLPTVFDKEGVVTAAGASGICDGAGSIIVASEQAVNEHNLTPLCRLVSYQSVGCDPSIMGIGPVPAIQMALEKANLSLAEDVDRVEINEAYAAQVLACAKALDLDMDKTNLHGGAISLGHPLGASGSRITAHLAHEFAYNQSSKIHVGAACIGGGQGIAVVLERA
eukprot:Nitzschia sp. Nitz4//scaffold60_size111251//69500//72600//NITZ4_004154-RA/size111251-snap-gene-0.195-mRNA-1//-1//CDS//3329555585//8439//frame0